VVAAAVGGMLVAANRRAKTQRHCKGSGER
jgi:hypothetical protein